MDLPKDNIELKRITKRMRELGCDTAVQCKTCGRIQYLEFKNGLKNGWSICCGETMPIVTTTANITEEMTKAIDSQIGGLLKWKPPTEGKVYKDDEPITRAKKHD